MRADGQLSAARGRRIDESLAAAAADMALAPDFAALDTRAALQQCLPVRRKTGPDTRRSRRGPGDEPAGSSAPAGPKARKEKQGQDDARAPVGGRCILLYAPGVLRGRSP